MLLYALLHLSGYGVSLNDLKNFRQFGSITPGHPEWGVTPGVETTTGPLGQGFANGVGMAIAAKMMASRFNTHSSRIFNHRIYAIVSDGDLMEGITAEAASLAGHLGLANLIYFYDSNGISIEGSTDLTWSEKVKKRFKAYHWHVISIDGHDHDEIHDAIQEAQAENERPSLIIARTHIGKGSPNKQDTAGVHGSPLGEAELQKTKENLNWPLEPSFYIPAEVKALFAQRQHMLKQEYATWQENFECWQGENRVLAAAYQNFREKKIPADLLSRLSQVLPTKPEATRVISGLVLQELAKAVPCLIGGSADLEPSTKTYIKDSSAISKDSFSGRNFHFGIREHAMGAVVNGLALYGGFIPYGATFLVFSDYMRPPIRLAALMGLQSIFVFTHDSLFVGEDGPTHQPVEQLSALRLIPNLTTIRPADGLETAFAWTWAIQHQTGPTALILSRQNLPPLPRPANFHPEDMARGGYIIADSSQPIPELIILATGSEVSLALAARELLQTQGHDVRVVSFPSTELFDRQPPSYRQAIIPAACRHVVAIELGVSALWPKYAGREALIIGLDRFGASAPQAVLAEQFGFTPQKVVDRIKAWLAVSPQDSSGDLAPNL
jgi:transketolase